MGANDELERAREIVALIGDDEELAKSVRWELARHFGWTYAAYDRSDIEEWTERPLTDDEWFRVSTSKAWLDVIPDQMHDGVSAAASISLMLDELGIDN